MITVSHELLAAHTFTFSPLGASKRIALSPPQQAIVNEFLNPTNKDLQVIAGAGAGKTATIVESVTQVLAAGHCTERELLLVSFSANARESLQKKLRGQINNERTTIHTFSSFALQITGADPNNCSDTMSEGSHTRDLMAKAESTVGGNTTAWEAAFAENGEDEDSSTSSKLVLELSRLHSKGYLVSDPQFFQLVPDPTVQQILLTFSARLKVLGQFTFGENAIEALRALRALGDKAPSCKLVIVDEAQDNDIVQLEMAEILSRNGRLVLVGDPRQCICRWRGAEPDFFINFSKRPTTKVLDLTDNYRSHDEIVFFGNAVASHMPRSASVTKPMTSNSPGDATYFADYWQVAKRIVMQTQIAALQHDQIAVLARTWRPLWNIFKRLVIAGVRVSFKKFKGWKRSALLQLAPIWTVKDLASARERGGKATKYMYDVAIDYLKADASRTLQDYMNIVPIKPEQGGRTSGQGHGPPAVRLSTIQSVKGEEFDQVWLLDTGINPRTTPGMSEEEVAALEEDELRIYYTGITRAKKRLILVDRVPSPVYSDGALFPSPFYPKLLEFYRGGAAMHPRLIPQR
jgi:superfamily I DNA/RNA helicase